MSAKKKLIVAAMAALALLALGVAAALVTDFDSPELGRLALGRIGESSGLDLKAEGFRLNLLRGLELDGVEARGRLADGEMTASMERLVLKHRPADLLGGTLTVTELVLDRPQVELTSTAETSSSPPPAPPPPAAPPAEAAGETADDRGGRSLDLRVSTIRLVDGTLLQRSSTDEADVTEVRSLDMELHDLRLGAAPAPGGEAPAGRGTIRIAEIVLGAGAPEAERTTIRDVGVEIEALTLPSGGAGLASAALRGALEVGELVSGDTRAQGVSSRLELAEGRLAARELRLTAPQGVLRGQLDADVAADPMTYDLRLDGDALSTGVLLGIGDVRGLGTSKLELSASGTGSDARLVVGDGRLTVGSGTLPDHPMVAQVQQILGNVALVGTGFDSFPVDFDIRSNRLLLERCELRAGPVSFTVSGWLDFDGPIELKLSVLAPREGLAVEEIPREVMDALSEDDGRVNLPMLVTGTSEASAVGLDREVLRQLGKRYVKKQVEKEIGKALRGLFGKKRDGR